VERISEFEDGEHFPEPWIAEEEAQGTPLGLLNAGIILGLFFCLACVVLEGVDLDVDGLTFSLLRSSLSNP
jgi:hypothetical protein